MSGHLEDLWTRPDSTGRRVRTARWGSGKRWRVVWHALGRRSATFTSKDEATAFLTKVRHDQRAGTYVEPSRLTVAEYGAVWAAQQVQLRASSARSLSDRLRVHVYPTFGDELLAAVSRSQVQAWVAGLSVSLAPSTVHVVYGCLSALMRSAVEDRLRPFSPCSRISLPEVSRGRLVPLTSEQVRVIAAAMTPRGRAMVWLAAASGMRSGELRGLTVDRISPALHVRGGRLPAQVSIVVDRQWTDDGFAPPKSKAGVRRVVVGEPAVSALAKHLAEFGVGRDGLVFTSGAGGPVSRSVMGDRWRDATAALGLPPRSGWHDLRHFHASLLIADGRSPRAVADRLGHADPAETLRTYAHLWPSDEARSVAVVASELGRGAHTERT